MDQTCISTLNKQDILQNWVTLQLLLAFEIRNNRHIYSRFSVHVQQLCRGKAIEGLYKQRILQGIVKCYYPCDTLSHSKAQEGKMPSQISTPGLQLGLWDHVQLCHNKVITTSGILCFCRNVIPLMQCAGCPDQTQYNLWSGRAGFYQPRKASAW